ncbi:gliding motility-associated ABC transporter substrate-binding protein GldG [Hufsiella ginkgonis]|uniref:Gliding motility-associated ABC transporter substrate-binding protein GldG n=1 Tax=Hufsiella ginkgonis TaxID=2695274 RepID=A0A7K1XS73_9SPHI|nr:gliding motility-associated ABC transporter substrate-binding protein GldG [Hufsiella ginkgonis]MXV13697.1 gliding motility-associated ABC transporter substrate-binding protein GldG [Hufsiella ginkgonis]
MVSRKKKDLVQLAWVLAGIILFNLVSAYYFTRFDFTTEKRYTLSGITERTLSGLKENMEITVYLEGDFPAGFKRLNRATRDMLTDLRAYSGGKLRFSFANPLKGSKEQQESLYNSLAEKDIFPTQVGVPTEGGVSQILVYPAAVITYQGRQVPVRLLPYKSGAIDQQVLNGAVENLEYVFTSAIQKVLNDGKPRIGFTEGHGELADIQLNDAMNSLRDGYEVGRVDLGVITFAGLDKMKMLVIPKPETPFTEAEKFKIDYFVMHGGSVLWTIDEVSAEMDSLHGKGSQLAFNKDLNLDDLLFNYGVRINHELIADMNCAQIPVKIGGADGQPQIVLRPWLFYPLLTPQVKHPLVRNLDPVRSEFISTVDTIAIPNVKKTVVLSSSAFSRILNTPGMISLSMIGQEADPAAFRNIPLPAAVLLEGTFPSAFNGRPLPKGVTGTASLPAKSRFTRMIVAGDGDLLKNQVNASDGSPFPLGYDRYSRQQYGNKNFLLNCADYLTDDSGIISLRNKDITVRLLDRPRIREEKLFWQVLNIGLPLVLITICGIFQHYYRKRKYAFNKV